MNTQTTTQKTIKMTAFDKIARKRYEVTPDTLNWVRIEDCTPIFWADDRYVIIPDCTAESVMEEWLAQY